MLTKYDLRQSITLILFALGLTLFGQEVNAQGQRRDSNVYKGLTASFGTRSILLSSDIPELHQKNLTENGGQLGIVYGNSLVRTRLNAFGYYSSSGNTPGTTSLYTSSAAVHFYPLQLFSRTPYRLKPYFTGEMSYDRFKFFGYYVHREPGITNYSQAEAPYLGKMKQINGMLGAGLELALKEDYDFIHFFAEFKYVNNLSANTGHEVFSRTELQNKTHFVVGISFGSIR